ncbi:uncharacterized [Tachysurus ichikawai]
MSARLQHERRCLDNCLPPKKKGRIAESSDDAAQPNAVTWTSINVASRAESNRTTYSQCVRLRHSVRTQLAPTGRYNHSSHPQLFTRTAS